MRAVILDFPDAALFGAPHVCIAVFNLQKKI